MEWICVAPETENSRERALYYAIEIGKKRIYRWNYPAKTGRLKLLVYATEEEAQKVCDHTNKHYNDRFSPVVF